MRARNLPPSAAALMPSLRGVGYSLQTAISDLVDNSITANATQVAIGVDWNAGTPIFSILDDGNGMDEDALLAAMRFGGIGPEAPRHERDLGRFGLGLKTASLSQARRVTVASMSDGQLTHFRWDIDHIIAARGDWELLEGMAPGSERHVEPLRTQGRGTLVLWESVDFGRRTEHPNEGWLRDQLRQLERHLGMVFHRYIETSRLEILLAGRPVAAWDPFLISHDPHSDRIGEDIIPAPGGRVRVAGFVLPHKDRFASETDLSRAGGPDGWNAHQGCYVYRGDRMLTAGGWMGLGRGRAWTRDEVSRLARIRIDIPTSGDAEWQIDVKKSVARPPAGVRDRLERLAESVRKGARERYTHRGPRRGGGAGSTRQSLWTVSESADVSRYRIDRTHPAVQAAASGGADELADLLGLIEKTVPVERIWLDRSENAAVSVVPVDAALIGVAVRLVRKRLAGGESLEVALLSVASAEPFDTIPNIIDSIRSQLGAQ